MAAYVLKIAFQSAATAATSWSFPADKWRLGGTRGSLSAPAGRGMVLSAHPTQMETNGRKVEAPENKRRETVLQEGANQAKDKSDESW